HELLDAKEIRRRYPPLVPSHDLVALYEPMAGFVDPEQCTLAYQQLAAKLGAELHFNEPMLSWESTANGVRVTTTRATYEADSLVLAPGPWAPGVFGDLALPLAIERQVMFWLDPIGGVDAFHPDRFPIYIWELEDGAHFYGFPSQGDGVKVACYHGGAFCDAESVDRNVSADEIARMRAIVADRIPALRGPLRNAVTCMYTNTPDLDFILGTHPRHANVVIASPCSGHGYKFASVIGEILADLATEGTTPHPIARFTPSRFAR
ncbi:MAG TPA: N-methyl-L-tryptophan oxidase, partial [Thermoanaerobaculia bacterium]|nr:N-methyl-L-tryptophan oxidase [Thermoanaerobaculia bacterium]